MSEDDVAKKRLCGHPYGQNIRTPDAKWPPNAQTCSADDDSKRAAQKRLDAMEQEFKRPPLWRDEMEAELAEKGAVAPTSVLLEANGLVNGERQDAYGPPKEDFGRTARLASIALEKKLREPLDAGDVALVMICVKLSREVYRHKRDNCVDGAGYFGCLDRVRS